MNLTRSKYRDSTYAEAVAAGYDLFQLKYDGHWCACIALKNTQAYLSDTYRQFADGKLTCPDGIYIGEYMRGTQWSLDPSRKGRFFVFDLTFEGDARPYADRYRLLRTRVATLPTHWQIVQNYRMQSRDSVWTESVEKNGFEGLVYHKSTALPGGELLREKRVFTLEGKVIRITPGEGKHLGRMGAVIVQLPDGTEASIGNGWGDDERQLISDTPEVFIGKTLELTTNAIFTSGNVRHARFVRWREDR